jgi:hypothetical protein
VTGAVMTLATDLGVSRFGFWVPAIALDQVRLPTDCDVLNRLLPGATASEADLQQTTAARRGCW